MRIINNMVLFYGSRDIYSNWHPRGFILDGIHFNRNEQYVMYRKAMLFHDLETAEKILATTDPKEQKELGRQVQGFDEEIWVAHREGIMLDGCLAKFSQNQDLKAAILATDNMEIVEASLKDRIWGVGRLETDPLILDKSKWRGLNLLGKSLMRARQAL